VLIGSSNTFVFEGYMVTPRGYTNKYTWDGQPIAGQTPGRSLVVPEEQEQAQAQAQKEPWPG